MIGTYKIKQNGKLLAAIPNLITNEGRMAVLRFLAGEIPNWAGAVAIGSGTQLPARAQRKMQFEFGRAMVDVSASNLVTNKVINKATFDELVVGNIYEIGLYSSTATEENNMILVFDDDYEPIELDANASHDAMLYRAGGASVKITAPASTSSTILLPDYFLDTSGMQATDGFSLAYINNNANTNTIAVRLHSSANSYFQHIISPTVSSGYFVADWQVSAFTQVNNPDWNAIESLSFVVTAKSGGTTNINLDGLRFNDTDVYADQVLVSRALLPTPIAKRMPEELDIEYEVKFNI